VPVDAEQDGGNHQSTSWHTKPLPGAPTIGVLIPGRKYICIVGGGL
jgi:hypothetical protein